MSRPLVLLDLFTGSDPYFFLPDEQAEQLRKRFPEVEFRMVRDAEARAAALPEAEVLFGWHLSRREFPRAKRLRWIHSAATGVRRLLYPELVSSDIVLTCARGVHAPFMAEQVMAWILAHYRRLPALERARAERRWSQAELLVDAPPDTLFGRTVLVVGFGSTGNELASRLHPFGARVSAVTRSGNPVPVAKITGTLDDLDRLLPEADIVVNCLPNTDATAGVFNAARFAAMRPHTFFANVGRGSTVDEAALAEALHAGRLAGAGLDVFAQEPLPPESPLWDAPGVQISPHVAGVGGEMLWQFQTVVFENNLRRYLAGEPLEDTVDKIAGY